MEPEAIKKVATDLDKFNELYTYRFQQDLPASVVIGGKGGWTFYYKDTWWIRGLQKVVNTIFPENVITVQNNKKDLENNIQDLETHVRELETSFNNTIKDIDWRQPLDINTYTAWVDFYSKFKKCSANLIETATRIEELKNSYFQTETDKVKNRLTADSVKLRQLNNRINKQMTERLKFLNDTVYSMMIDPETGEMSPRFQDWEGFEKFVSLWIEEQAYHAIDQETTRNNFKWSSSDFGKCVQQYMAQKKEEFQTQLVEKIEKNDLEGARALINAFADNEKQFSLHLQKIDEWIKLQPDLQKPLLKFREILGTTKAVFTATIQGAKEGVEKLKAQWEKDINGLSSTIKELQQNEGKVLAEKTAERKSTELLKEQSTKEKQKAIDNSKTVETFVSETYIKNQPDSANLIKLVNALIKASKLLEQGQMDNKLNKEIETLKASLQFKNPELIAPGNWMFLNSPELASKLNDVLENANKSLQRDAEEVRQLQSQLNRAQNRIQKIQQSIKHDPESRELLAGDLTRIYSEIGIIKKYDQVTWEDITLQLEVLRKKNDPKFSAFEKQRSTVYTLIQHLAVLKKLDASKAAETQLSTKLAPYAMKERFIEEYAKLHECFELSIKAQKNESVVTPTLETISKQEQAATTAVKVAEDEYAFQQSRLESTATLLEVLHTNFSRMTEKR